MPSIRYKLHEIGKSIRKQISVFGSEWMGEPQGAFLGDYSQQVVSPNAGMYYARLYNGKLIEVYNAANLPAKFDLHITIGRKKSRPDRWILIEERSSYLAVAGHSGVAGHWHQHTVDGWDRVPTDLKQIVQFAIQVTDGENFIVGVNGRVIQTSAGHVKVATQFLDLSSYVITEGAKYVAIEVDEDGLLSLNDGAVFGSLDSATNADFPATTTDKTILAFVAIYESQDELKDADIILVTPLAGVSGSGSVAWGDITGTLSDQTDLQAALDAKADIDHTHADGGTGTGAHLHGLVRWNGEGGQDTFELPDVWEYVDSLMLNGLEEDPTVYSLSGDGTQIILDTALLGDTLVMAHGVIAGV